MFSQVSTACQRLGLLIKNVSVDEMMVMNYDRSYKTVRIRHKPIKSGFKIWALCDCGYNFSFIPHSNADPWKPCLKYWGILNHFAAVVATLADFVPVRSPLLQQNVQHCFYKDNYISTLKLFGMLRDRGHGAVETVRSNYKGFPRDLALRGKPITLYNWNEIGSIQCENKNVFAVAWIDNAPVQMMTTVHRVSAENTIERRRKRPRMTLTNDARVREVFGNDATKLLPIPCDVDDYNYHKGGADVADQLRASFTSHLCSRLLGCPSFSGFWILLAKTRI